MYQFTIGLNDLFSRPLGRLAANYNQTLNGMNRRASGLSGLMRPAMASVGSLGRRLATLTRPHTLNVNSSQVQAATSQVGALNRQLTRLDRNGRLRLANGRFATLGGSGSSSRSNAGNANAGGFGFMDPASLVKKALPYMSAAAIGAAAMSYGQKAMNSERDQFSLGVMLKSPMLAANMMGQFEGFAKKNPLLGMREVTESGTRLVSLNERTDRVLPIVSMMGDVSAATNNKLTDLIGILGQVKSKGQLYAEENLQFQERRINLNPYLAKVTGVKESKLADVMKDGRIGYEQVLRAINLMTAKGGIYHNMSERTGNETTFGKYQNLIETLDLQLTNLFKRTLPYVNKGIEATSGLLDSMDSALNGKLGTALIGAVDGVSELGGKLSSLAVDTGLVGKTAGETGILLQSVTEGFRLIGTMAHWLGKATEWVGPLLKGGPNGGLLGTLINPLGGLVKDFNDWTDTKRPKPLTKKAPVATTEEKWVKANGLTGLSADVQHERFQESRWRRSQGESFYKLPEAEQHKRFLAARERGLKGRQLLGASGLLEEDTTTKKKKGKGGSGDGSSNAAGVRGDGPRNVSVVVNIKEGIHLHTATIAEGMVELERLIKQTVVRAAESAGELSATS